MGTEDRKGEKETEEIEAIVRFYIIDYLWLTKTHPIHRFLIHKDNLFILTLNSYPLILNSRPALLLISCGNLGENNRPELAGTPPEKSYICAPKLKMRWQKLQRIRTDVTTRRTKAR